MKYSVFITFEGKSKVEVETFREIYDDLYGKVEPHITVMFPVEKVSDSIEESMKSISSGLGFQFEVSQKLVYEGEVGYLKISSGASEFNEIYNCLNSNNINAQYVPHITVLRNSVNKPTNIKLSSTKFIATSLVLESFDHTGYSNKLCIMQNNM